MSAYKNISITRIIQILDDCKGYTPDKLFIELRDAIQAERLLGIMFNDMRTALAHVVKHGPINGTSYGEIQHCELGVGVNLYKGALTALPNGDVVFFYCANSIICEYSDGVYVCESMHNMVDEKFTCKPSDLVEYFDTERLYTYITKEDVDVKIKFVDGCLKQYVDGELSLVSKGPSGAAVTTVFDEAE